MSEFMSSYNGKFAKKKMDFQTHSFGYGSGHDEKILKSISDHKNGNFYYIKDNKLVDECFLDCMGKLMTVIGQKGKIQLFMGQQCKIVKKYGEFWEENKDEK